MDLTAANSSSASRTQDGLILLPEKSTPSSTSSARLLFTLGVCRPCMEARRILRVVQRGRVLWWLTQHEIAKHAGVSVSLLTPVAIKAPQLQVCCNHTVAGDPGSPGIAPQSLQVAVLPRLANPLAIKHPQ